LRSLAAVAVGGARLAGLAADPVADDVRALVAGAADEVDRVAHLVGLAALRELAEAAPVEADRAPAAAPPAEAGRVAAGLPELAAADRTCALPVDLRLLGAAGLLRPAADPVRVEPLALVVA